MDVFRNEQVCYKIFYLLSEKYVDMFAFGMLNKFTYRYMLSMATHHNCITGFKTIEGRRHGEWIISCYSTSYYEGEMISWRRYVVPVPRWRAPSALGLDRSWQLGEIADHARYSTITPYIMAVAQYVDLMSPTNRDEVLKRYDWCEKCQRALPIELAGAPRQPNLKVIEKFLALSARADECMPDCASHMKN